MPDVQRTVFLQFPRSEPFALMMSVKVINEAEVACLKYTVKLTKNGIKSHFLMFNDRF